LLIGGLAGLFSAIVLTLEKIKLLKDPEAVLGCDLNPIIACGSVINTPQAEAFGFPNPIIGIVGFSVVALIGGAILAGAQFKRWFWIGLQLGVLFAVGFVHWLMFQSIFRINALCPYCMVVWAVTIPIFWYTLLYNLKARHISTPSQLKTAVSFASRHHADILLVWYLIIIGVILNHFWYYWKTLI
jgi:uncharacterized membrane protein